MAMPVIQIDLDELKPNVVGCATSAPELATSRPPAFVEENDGKQSRRQRRALRQERLNEQQRRWSVFLAIMSAFDIAISGVMIIVAMAHAYLDNGVSLYCLALQSLSHALSSVLLMCRFIMEARVPEDGPAGVEEGLLRQRRERSLSREKSMSSIMGVLMILSSIALLCKAIRKIWWWDFWYLDHVGMDDDAVFATRFLAFYGFIVYGGQAMFRFGVGRILRKELIWHSLVVSAVSVAFLLVLGITSTVLEERSWKAEPIAAIVLSMLCLAEGSRVISTHTWSVEELLNSNPQA